MLRITTQDNPRVLLVRLEGRLEGPWLAVLDESWLDMLGESSRNRRTRLCVDLAGVTFIDAAGRARLARMHQRGAEFVADNLVTRAIIAEIVAARSGGQAEGRSRKGRSRA